jgi:hypothetical protein
MDGKADENCAWEYWQAQYIQVGERDFELDLDQTTWPTSSAPSNWKPRPGSLSRTIRESDEEIEKYGKHLSCELEESILRVPSAPIHGLHRLSEYHVNDGHSENLHTLRLLRDPDCTKVRRVFLLHNGLNETQKMGLYYQLASHLIHQDQSKGTACILRPFPGHLTRSRFSGFAETPLDHYLWDGSHLFRQFLRFMLETQWLLSMLARRSSYRCISGLNLLAEKETPRGSRLDDSTLATAIESAWTDLHGVSQNAKPRLKGELGKAPILKDPADPAIFRESVRHLRELLGPQDRFGGETGIDGGADGDRAGELAIHAIGYSLGGFAAQSVFMSWPFLVSSCSTLLSGGALRELAPTAFADPEEWQTVLHSLRYELDEAMMNGLFRPKQVEARTGKRRKHVAGIELDLFLYLKSTFYEVFQQEYRGSFQTRLKAFRRRMLFVVGGNDPIVRPESVLDSGPPDGMNMLAIGGLGHFLGGRARDEEEAAQRSFWLPQVAGVIDALADEATKVQRAEQAENWLDEEMRLPHRTERYRNPRKSGEADEDRPRRLDIAERLAVDGDGALPGPLFERCLDDLLLRVDAKRGILFILRNEVPTVLLDEDAIREHAAVLHHDDVRIARYIDGLRERQSLILNNRERISFVLPWNAKMIMEGIDAPPGHPSQSEGGGGQMPNHTTPKQTWETFEKTWRQRTNNGTPDSMRVFDGRFPLSGGVPPLKAEPLLRSARSSLKVAEETPVQVSLPDCWIWMSPKFLLQDDDDPLEVDTGRSALCKVVPDRYLHDPNRLVTPLRKDHLRIITVSRARYNPRFRGRLVADPIAAREILLHATLCILGSVPFPVYDLQQGYMPATDLDSKPLAWSPRPS